MGHELQVQYVDGKTGIRKTTLPDTFFVTKYAFSPYHACEHGCVYCDGRAERYHVSGQFDRDVTVRQNMPDLLFRQLPSLREPGTIAISSGVSDAYQPVEAKEKLMRRCAEALADHSYSVHLLTKSSLALRDIDIWKRINERAGVTLMVSLVFLDDALRQSFEPRASSVEERLELMGAFKEAGMDVGLCAMPFLPAINDDRVAMEALFSRAIELGVSHALIGDLTLRPGRQKDFYFDHLSRERPELSSVYRRLYREERASGAPVRSQHHKFRQQADGLATKLDLPQAMPHAVYRNRFPLYDEIYILLHHMQDLYQQRGVDTRRLKRACQRYREWLLEKKKAFNRQRSQTYDSLEGTVRFLCATGGLEEIVANEKLAKFLQQVIAGEQIFDYRSLELRAALPER